MKRLLTRAHFLSSRAVSLFALALFLSACGGGAGEPSGAGGKEEPISIVITPSSATLPVGGSERFSAAVSGHPETGVVWRVDEPDGGSIAADGTYAAPMAEGVFHVVASSLADPSRSARATVTINAPATARISPAIAQVSVNERIRFSAEVTGNPDLPLVWHLEEGGAAGTIDSDGTYLAPATPGTYHLTIESPADPSLKATATIFVIDPPPLPPGSISIAPAAAEVRVNEKVFFSAALSGGTDPAVQWTVKQGPGGGTITPDGTYTAPGTLGTYEVIATSVADPTKSARATVTVKGPMTITLTPGEATVAFNESSRFTAEVIGGSGGVDWRIQEEGGGSIRPDGDRAAVYTAPAAEGTFHLIATGRTDRTAGAVAAIRVMPVPAVSIAIHPAEVSLPSGGSQRFAAEVTGSPNQEVTWQIREESGGGTITPEGEYTAPRGEGIFHITATSVADPAKSATAEVTVASSQTGRTVERVSIGSTGGQANGFSKRPFLSGDGRYVAFESDATNLAPNDANGFLDLFVHDRRTRTTRRVSVSSAGVEANDISFGAKVNADGRYIAFESDASNLVPKDRNGSRDLFLHDQQTGSTERVSVDSAGAGGNSFSEYAYLSGDGRFVAFYSHATNLASGDSNGVADIFVRDRLNGTTARVSVSSAGVQGDALSFCPSISDDGRYVSFVSYASNLVPGDTNGMPDIFVHDRATGTTTRVSVASSGSQGDLGSSDAKISGNGRFVAMATEARLVPGDANGVGDLYVHDLAGGTTTLVSVGSGGGQGNGVSWDARISRDGRYVTFDSEASNLVSGDANGATDIFVHDRSSGETVRVSVNAEGVEGNKASSQTRIAANGRFVAFFSAATNLVRSDTNKLTDIFVASIP